MLETEQNENEAGLGETIGRLFDVLVRRRWWILLTSFTVGLSGIAFVKTLPDWYTSEATLFIVKQQVPQRYVEALTVTSITDQLSALTLEILSRNRLLSIIEAAGLYPQLRDTASPEELAERMRKDVDIEPLWVRPLNDFNGFKVSFTSSDPEQAQDVTRRLTSLFIEEDLKSRGSQAASTTKFLAENVAEAKNRLDQQEQRLRDFKMSNLGGLPEQQQANLGTVMELRIQLQGVAASVTRAQQQRSYLESTINGQVARLQAERTALLKRFTEQHPEVRKKDQVIDGTTALLGRLKARSGAGASPQEIAALDDPFVAQMQGQVDANVAELAKLPADEQRLRAQIAGYQGRLNLTPVREQQLSAITRDYDLYKKGYTELLDKQLGSQLSARLGEQREGQHYQLIDAPTLPTQPSGPKRVKFSLMAIAGALALGFALALLRDVFDRSFHNEKDVQDQFSGPLVVGLPMLLTPREEVKRKRRLAFEWVAASVMILALIGSGVSVILYG